MKAYMPITVKPFVMDTLVMLSHLANAALLI